MQNTSNSISNNATQAVSGAGNSAQNTQKQASPSKGAQTQSQKKPSVNNPKSSPAKGSKAGAQDNRKARRKGKQGKTSNGEQQKSRSPRMPTKAADEKRKSQQKSQSKPRGDQKSKSKQPTSRSGKSVGKQQKSHQAKGEKKRMPDQDDRRSKTSYKHGDTGRQERAGNDKPQTDVKENKPLVSQQIPQIEAPKKKDKGRDYTIRVKFPISAHMSNYVKLMVGDAYAVEGFETGLPHAHPIAHIERAVVERLILSTCRGLRIIDAGGNAVRHHKNDGVFDTKVWNCCPVLDVTDVQRQESRKEYFKGRGTVNYCNHHVELCTCGFKADVIIGVDSLYYLHPLVLVAGMVRHGVRKSFFSVHRFPSFQGQYYRSQDGTYEVTYRRVGESRVRMMAKGNCGHYEHDALDWLESGQLRLPGGYSLLWNKMFEVGQTEVYQFILDKVDFDFSSFVHKPVASLNDVMARSENLVLKAKEVVFANYDNLIPITLRNAKVLKSRQFLSFIDERNQIHLPIEGLMALARIACHMARTKALFNQLVSQAKTHCKSEKSVMQMTAADQLLYVTYAPVVAMTLNFETEVESLSALRGVGLLNEEYQTELQRAFDNPSLMKRIGYFFTDFFGFTREGVRVNPPNTAASSKAVDIWSVVLHNSQVAGKGIQQLSSDVQKLVQGAQMESQHIEQRVGLSAGQNATRQTYQLDALYRVRNHVDKDLKPQNEGGVLKTKNTGNEEKADNQVVGALVFGVTSADSLAVLPCQDRDATLFSVKQKILAQVDKADTTEWLMLRKWVDKNFDDIFPKMPKKIEPMKYADWIGKYDLRRQTMIEQCVAKYAGGFTKMQFDQETNRKMFTKNEALSKRGELVCPRPIQSVGTLANYLLSPWINAFVGNLHESWSLQHKVVYCCGILPNELGNWYGQQVAKVQAGSHFLFENDFTQFDASIQVDALEFEQWVYKKLGVTTMSDGPIPIDGKRNWAFATLEAQLHTKGYTKWGDRYEIEGNRKSGDPNTSAGNSLVGGVAQAYSFAKEYARLKGLDLMSVKFTDLDYNQALLGDDNISAANLVFREYIEDGQFVRDLRKLGFASKLVVRGDIFLSEFCSQRFWHVSDVGTLDQDGDWILGSKPTKWLQRHAITTKTDLDEKQRKQFLVQSVQAAYCTNSFVPLIRTACNTYVNILQNEKLEQWRDKALECDTIDKVQKELAKVALSDDYKYRKGATLVYNNIPDSAIVQFEHIYQVPFGEVAFELQNAMIDHDDVIRRGCGLAVHGDYLRQMMAVDFPSVDTADHNGRGLEQAAVCCENGA